MEPEAALQEDTGGRRSASDHAHGVQVKSGRVEILRLGCTRLLLVLLLLPGGDVVLRPDIPQGVVVRAEAFRAVERLPDDGTPLRQPHKAVPVGHHLDHGRVDVLDEQEVS